MTKWLKLIFAFTLVFSHGCEKPDVKELTYLLNEITSKPFPGEYAKVQKLVEKGASVDYRDESSLSGNTPFLHAAGALSKERGKYTTPGLRDSAEREAVKIVKFLAAKGANIKATDESPTKRNALHLAALGGRAHMIRALVELGLAVDSRDAVNGTALMHAASGGCYDAVAALVELGADVNAEMNGGRTALDAAHQANTKEAYGMDMVTCKEHDRIIAFLEQRGARRGLAN